jgi:glutamate 5-kinase
MNRDHGELRSAKRVVVKIGTNLLTGNEGIDADYIDSISEEFAGLLQEGRQLLLVSSGAIGFGARELGITSRITDIRMRQACAAIGQPLLMYRYRSAFARHGTIIAQVLLTREVFNNRRSYLNLRNAVEQLLSLGSVPIFNENDSISTEEIGNAFGDNDRLSALVASKVDADLLTILSDIDGLYDGDPKSNPDAGRISRVEEVDERIMSYAGSAGSEFSTGGMTTKLKAVRIAAAAGCATVLAHGREERILSRILTGEDVGTLFLPGEKLSNRSRWILNSAPKGTIVVDEGAVRALRRHKSLLASGIRKIEGVFDAGDVVRINDVAKAVPAYNSRELERLIGKHTSEVVEIFGEDRREEIARPEDIVFVEG